ncbi:MAG: D-alanine--D-alanine ligase [Labilithrix sp.]|nr:D-alanine--D-alanine ligase [Labilithrix sp.]
MSSTAARSRRFSVAVIQGGPASEAEVSRASATSVARALGEAGHRVVRLELDVYLADSLRTGGFDVVFPVAHGAVGEDGSLQGLLEVLDLPYVGSGVLASAVAMNKRTAKILFAAAGLPIARSISAQRGLRSAASEAERALHELGDKLVVKPCSNGSAIGVARFPDGTTSADVAQAIEAAWAVDETALVEVFAPGREVTCGVLELREPAWLPPTEIRAPNDAFYTYQARYAPGRSDHLCPAPLGDALTRRVQEIAVAAHRALGCRDLSRVDFVVPSKTETDGEPTLLEVNTMPGFTDTSLFPEAAAIAGVPMPELCHGLVNAAGERGPTGRNAPLPLPRA